MKKEEKLAIDSLASNFRKMVLKNKNNNDALKSDLRKNNVQIKYFDNQKYDAFLEWDKKEKGAIISVNINQAQTRQNFSIAHELGHLVLDWKWLPGIDLSKKNEEILSIKYRGADEYNQEETISEKQANEFAAAFLMPDDEIEELLRNNDEADVTKLAVELADRFNVSVQAAQIRISNFLYLRGNM